MAGLLNQNPYGGGLLGNPLQAGLLGQNALTNTYSQPNNVDRFLGGLTRLPFAIAEGIGNRVMQAHEAMPWGGNNPAAIGYDPQAGTIDPSVMVPFATDVAGMATTGSLAAPAVRNATGMGIRAYHGSPHDFDRFSMDKSKDRYMGRGMYLAPNPDEAVGYGRFLHQYDLDVENPAIIETSNLNFQISDDYAKSLQQQGHDAIILRIIDRDTATGEIADKYDKEIVVWDEGKARRLNMLDLESPDAESTVNKWYKEWRDGS